MLSLSDITPAPTMLARTLSGWASSTLLCQDYPPLVRLCGVCLLRRQPTHGQQLLIRVSFCHWHTKPCMHRSCEPHQVSSSCAVVALSESATTKVAAIGRPTSSDMIICLSSILPRLCCSMGLVPASVRCQCCRTGTPADCLLQE